MKTVTTYSRDGMWHKAEPSPDIALISISTLPSDKRAVFQNGWSSCLASQFIDTQSSMSERAFDERLAKQMFKFILDNGHRDIVVHCDAGMSRSVAVAEFIHDYFGHDIEFKGIAKDNKDMNQLVYTLLVKAYELAVVDGVE
jgi:predicted protein tyrosine phosphatase